MKKFFKRITLAITSLALVLVAGLTLASCASGIKGSLDLTVYRTVVDATVTFDSNVKLDESSTKVTVKLYDKDDTYKSTKTVSLSSYVGNAKFEDLSENTAYTLKLYVTYGGYEELIDSKGFTTKNDGTDDKTAIEVSTVDDFLNMVEDKDAYYKLTADLDFTEKTSVGIFTGSSEAFKGTFDGQNHTLKNITLASNEYTGLFGYLDEATIKDLNIETVNANLTSTAKYAGALYGYAVNSTIKNVTIKDVNIKNASASVTTSNSNFAAFAGYSESTELENVKLQNGYLSLTDVRPSASYNSSIGLMFGTVSGNSPLNGVNATGSVLVTTKSTGKIYVGGFAGAVSSADLIKDSAFSGLVKVTRSSSTLDSLFVGGFGGATAQGQANLDNCISIADVTVLSDTTSGATESATSIAKKLYVGGIMGNVSSTQIGVKNCKYLPLKDGVKVLNQAPSADTTSAQVGLVSLTFAKVQGAVASKVENNVALEDKLTAYGPEAVASTVDTASVTAEITSAKADAQVTCFLTYDENAVKSLFTTTNFTAAKEIKIVTEYTTVEVTIAEGSKTLSYTDGVLKITPTSEETNEKVTIKLSYNESNVSFAYDITALLAAA